MKNNHWNLWNKLPQYGETLYGRATGKLAEMESSKSLSKLLKPIYRKGMTVCDVGCGAGHYLVSFRKMIDPNIDYIGVDSTKYYLELARKAFGNPKMFVCGSIYDLPFPKNYFDIVVCNNVLLHLPPPPSKPIAELIRIAKKRVIIRTLVGESNYVIKRFYESDESKTKIEENDDFGYFNMYTQDRFRRIILTIDPSLNIKIVPDKDFKKFDNTRASQALKKIATKVVHGKQISGNLIYDWRYIIIEK